VSLIYVLYGTLGTKGKGADGAEDVRKWVFVFTGSALISLHGDQNTLTHPSRVSLRPLPLRPVIHTRGGNVVVEAGSKELAGVSPVAAVLNQSMLDVMWVMNPHSGTH
jgi:hypothetical protein